jgi:nitrate reductase NapAB chaperone NapD
MKKLIVQVEDSKVDTLMEFLNTLDYVSVSQSESEAFESEKEEEIKNRLTMIESGSMKVRSWEDAKKDIFQI